MLGYTPMIEQYLEIKHQHQDAILFFRLGDFYEMFFDDALLASKELGITLTSREGGQDKRVPMCGIPFHASQNYIGRLIQKGYKVAICEQIEEPGPAKGIFRRQVIRVITPGTFIEGQPLEEKKNNFVAAVSGTNAAYGLAIADIGTGLFMAAQFDGENAETLLLEELSRLQPLEVILSSNILAQEINRKIKKRMPSAVSTLPDDAFNTAGIQKLLSNKPGSSFDEPLNKKYPLASNAAGGVFHYLKETAKCDLLQINKIEFYSPGHYLILDDVTRRNLELKLSLRDRTSRHTLVWVLDHTLTAMGGRQLRSWIDRPLLNLDSIIKRQEAVEETAGSLIFRYELKQILSSIYDLERLTARVAYGSANARDLLALKKSVSVLPSLVQLLSGSHSELWLEISKRVIFPEELWNLLDKAITDDPPASVRDGGIIKAGYHPEVDRLRNLSAGGKEWLVNLEIRERERTGIKSLKVGFNKIFGYYLEVTRSNLGLIPDDYIRKQTLANGERFITPELKELEEKILGAQDRLVQLEYEIFSEIRSKVGEAIPGLQKTAQAVAVADCLYSLAEAAVKGNYTRPSMFEGKRLYLKESRHPVLEKILGTGEFIPNDLLLNEENHFIILTGPNMAGKSTYMRQAALLVLMAQIGSFVPARQAEIGLVDRILTRVGASDDLAAGQSTFLVEMNECREIVKSATEKSFIIMDEIGRGTSTYDGISIAWALVEFIAQKLKAKTLFSTHYQELTELETLTGVNNFTMTVQEKGDNIIFLRQVSPGKADRSYGIQVARLAGLPDDILNRAREIMDILLCRQNSDIETASVLEKNATQDELSIEDDLAALNIWELTPLEALNILARWQMELKKSKRLY
ncbi:MAG TPA: DNA mismatch repair protein MutS [Desulfotomaculum sp.]|nr:MAG: DNA mismatch repair protein MutS [Desulfotomaculum sp. 46_80]KUK85192.1 MAG: DNA mismatch repair protein MutS [Desulfofundulus kuznetsovii]HAG12212.1 DNA mismatch repair protein MutS [Desulfotomaculum sp.]HBY04416.1 DNA mismatch repair protein MutS [Desulfotomaculum sp.]